MEKVKCKICKRENKLDRHYCSNCGNNLSISMGKTDFLLLLIFLKRPININIFFTGSLYFGRNAFN